MDIHALDVNTPVKLINEALKDSLIGFLKIKIEKISNGLVEATMPVGPASIRHDGRLNGSANLVLAETLAGLGSLLIIDQHEYDALGIQVNANHIRSLKEGTVHASAKIIHQGKQTHIWNVDLTNDDGKLISTARVTNMIVKRNG